jgi:DNA invertase Pin-like site-specific DNA recombinase
MQIHTTYAHYKPDGSMFYIGKGSVSRAHSASGRNIVWKRTVEKHGGFKVEILGRWKTEQEAFDHEIFLIDTIKKMGIPLVNIAEGGLGSTGFRHTAEHKAFKTKMMLERNPMSNPETRIKQREALLSAMSRPDVKRHKSLALLGKKLSAEHVESLRNCHPTRPCVINGAEYKSLMEASRMLGIRHGTLYRWLNNPEVKHTGKYAHIIECRWL